MASDAELKEAQGRAETAQKEVADLTEAGEKRDTELARLQESAVMSEATTVAKELLGKVEHLPEITQSRMVESLAKAPPLKDGKLDRDAFATAIDEAAKSEIEYLAKLTESGKISGMGVGGGNDDEANQKSLVESFTTILGGDKGLAETAAKGR